MSKISNLLFAVVLIFFTMGCANLSWTKPWQSEYDNGPLALPKGYFSQTGSATTKVGEKFIFGSAPLKIKPNGTITVISIEPTNVPKGIKFRQMGYYTKVGVGALDLNTFTKEKSSYGMKSLPFKISNANPYKQYAPVIALSAQKPGVYTVQGLIITYKWKNKIYKDYYRTQFTLYCEKPSQQKIDLPPARWNGITS